ncbi:methyl-accepting chemotaxis protein [Ohtaekwangia koreensis]|uniref:Methyl-accepting chemotaxis protein n=2 Tax=Ohtaekwangia koreensis TaxID=688867 RepID=A0A1T5LBI5_9BACT|nr:methyl-accepting chemotaxis protein [Ohtaekwangia koreensis]
MLNKMTIRNKLVLAFAMLVTLMIIIFAVAFLRIGNMNNRINMIMDGTVKQQASITRVRQMIMVIMRDQKKVIIAETDQEINELSRSIDASVTKARSEFDILKSISSGELTPIISQMEIKLDDFFKTNAEIVKLATINSENIAKASSFNDSYTEFLKASATLEELIIYINNSGTKDQLLLASRIKELFLKLYSEEKALILSSNARLRESIIAEASSIENELEISITRLSRGATGDVSLLLDKYQRQSSNFYTVHKEVMSLAGNATNARAMTMSNDKGDSTGSELAAVIDSYLGIINAKMENDRLETSDLYYNSVVIMCMIILLAVLISVMMAVWLLRGISSSLNIATLAVKKLSAGDFSADVKITIEDEIGLMLKELQFMIVKLRNSVDVAKRVSKGDLMIDFSAQKSHGGELDEALEQMVNNLRDIAVTIYNGADNVTAASQQVASASQQMSQGAQEQASAAEEVSSSMEQMAANILQNTDNSRETEKIANKALKDIQAGSQSVSQAVEAITTIADKIIIIEEIASKTDLLALNAAVEAARAGEHGKGFAVVAAEVRKLAERSQRAAAEINEISAQTVRQAKESKELLINTLPDINKTAELVQEIAASSLEQNQGASQVNKAIQQLSQVTQGNASAAEEMSSNAEELNTQAEELKAAISYFKIDAKTSARSTGKITKDKQKYSEKDVQHAFSGNHKGFDLKLDNGPLDSEFTEF